VEGGSAQRRGMGEEARRHAGWGQGSEQGDLDDELLQWLIGMWLSGQMGARGRKFWFRHARRRRAGGEEGTGDGRTGQGRKRGGMGGTGAGAGAGTGAGAKAGPHKMRQPGPMPGESDGPNWDQFAHRGQSTPPDTSWEEFRRQRERERRP